MRDTDERSLSLRRKIIDVMAKTRMGHIKSAYSCLEIVRVLYDDILKPDDKFIMSKGHGCLAQYVLLADKGIIPEEELYKMCSDGALLGGHPSPKIPGVEVGTGSLGHGLPLGVGFALAGYRTYVLMGDGECNEGSVWEAAMCASHHHLTNLTVIIDRNKQQSYGLSEDVLDMSPLYNKWYSFEWNTRECEGHDIQDIKESLRWKSGLENSTAIIAHTVKGKGIKFVEDDPRWHYKNDITDQEILDLYRGLNDYETYR